MRFGRFSFWFHSANSYFLRRKLRISLNSSAIDNKARVRDSSQRMILERSSSFMELCCRIKRLNFSFCSGVSSVRTTGGTRASIRSRTVIMLCPLQRIICGKALCGLHAVFPFLPPPFYQGTVFLCWQELPECQRIRQGGEGL